MKMTGMSVGSTARSLWRSKPVSPGREISRMRQLGTGVRGWSRNSCAEAKVSGCQPSQRISNCVDSRTHRSSSATKTIGVTCNMGGPPFHGQVCAPKLLLHCAHLTDAAPLLKEFYNDNPMEINEMRIVLRFTALWCARFCSRGGLSAHESRGTVSPLPKYRRYHRLIVHVLSFCSHDSRGPIQSGCERPRAQGE